MGWRRRDLEAVETTVKSRGSDTLTTAEGKARVRADIRKRHITRSGGGGPEGKGEVKDDSGLSLERLLNKVMNRTRA